MLSEPPFTVAVNNWKRRRPSADEWVRKLWYLYTMEYFAGIKRITFESVLMRWMNLEPIIDSEVSYKVKVKVKVLSRIRLFSTPWTGAYQAPLSMGFSRQEY